jgi:isoamylase
LEKAAIRSVTFRGTDQALAEFAYRFTGSSDLYQGSARRPYASVNFITAHDGFTLRDLVSYNDKHNEANGEGSRDGESHNRSWNCGVEGPTNEPQVVALRNRQVRNFLTTLMLSQGVPMLLGGDEIGRTQQGNNNAYCQDNEISWYDWKSADEDLLQFTRGLIRMRHRHPVFCRRRWFQGRAIHGSRVSDIGWFTPGGTEMSEEDWQAGFAKSLGVFLNGRGIATPNERGEPVVDDSFYAMFNANHEPLQFTLPEAKWGRKWVELLETDDKGDEMDEERTGSELRSRAKVRVQAWSMALLRRLA